MCVLLTDLPQPLCEHPFALSLHMDFSTLPLWGRTRPVFRLWRDMLRMSHVSASTQSCPSSSLDQKMVSKNPPFPIQAQPSPHCISHVASLTIALCHTAFSLYRYGAYLALKHLPPREHTELWHGESVVCVRPQGFQQCGTRL